VSLELKKLIAIDIGNGVTSITTGGGDKYDYASLALKHAANTPRIGSDLFKLKSGEHWVVGDNCRHLGVKSRSTDSSYYESPEFAAVFKYGLNMVGIKSIFLVTGLPTEFYDKHKAAFSKNLKAWAIEEGYQIEKLIVLPQHAGAFMDPNLLDVDGSPIDRMLLKGRGGVIDIGQGTTDAGMFANGQPTASTFGTSEGVSDIYKDILALLRSPPEDNLKTKSAGGRAAAKPRTKRPIPEGFRLDSSMDEHGIDSWVRSGYMPHNGTKIEFAPITQPILEAFAGRLLPQVITQVWGSTGTLDYMLCAGGGSAVLGPKILGKHIMCRLVIPADPGRSIVNGYHEFGVQQLKKAG